METEKGLETETKVPETITPPVLEVKPPTAEELQKQLADVQRKYEETSKVLNGTNASLKEKTRKLQEKENFQDEIDTLKNMVKVLAVQRDSNGLVDDLEAVAKEKRPDINKAFDELEQKQKVKKYQDQVNSQVKSIQDRVEALGLTENDETYWEIYKLATNATPADFKLADIRLKKIEKEKEKPVDTKPIDDKDKTIADLQAKLKKLEMGKSGQLDVETGLPSGSGSVIPTDMAQFRQWIVTIPQDVYEKEYASKVTEMRRLGQIK
jgi:hypothetical protein